MRVRIAVCALGAWAAYACSAVAQVPTDGFKAGRMLAAIEYGVEKCGHAKPAPDVIGVLFARAMGASVEGLISAHKQQYASLATSHGDKAACAAVAEYTKGLPR